MEDILVLWKGWLISFKVLGGGQNIYVHAATYVYFNGSVEGEQRKYMKFKGGATKRWGGRGDGYFM